MATHPAPSASTDPPAQAPPRPPGPVPLPAVFALTFLGSVGTGAVTNGLAFLTDAAFAFGERRNLVLAAMFGAVYVVSAALVAPLLERIERAFEAVTPRRVLIGIHVVLGLACLLPRLSALLDPSGKPQEWSVWVMAAVYALLTGALWPIVEAYLSGGRRGATLRAATGRFNVVWSAALVVAFWAMLPLNSLGRPLDLLTALGVLHLVSLVLLRWFSVRPAAHGHDDHEPSPPVYRELLVVFRWLLPTSYLVVSTLAPLLPALIAGAGIAPEWKPPLASVWLAARVAVFVVFDRWHGWHGRWWVAGVSICGVVAAFGLCLLAPLVPGVAASVGMLVVGLAAFGVCQGMIYLAALYYAMEDAGADVGGGGAHEALIGLGYLAGPLIALGVAAITTTESRAFEPVVFAIVFLLAGGITAGTLRHVAGKRNGPVRTPSGSHA